MRFLRRASGPLALVIAAAAAFGTHLWFETRLALEGQHTTLTVATDGTGTIADQQITLVSTAFDLPGLTHPDGTRTLTVRLTSDGAHSENSCRSTTLVERDGQHRTWNELTSAATAGSAGSAVTCTDEPGRYDIEAVFILPSDATGPFRVELADTDVTGVLAFGIEP